MFDLSQAFGTDTNTVEEGATLTLTDGSYLTIARIPNSNYRRELSAQVEKHSAVLDLNTPESEVLNETIMADVLSKTVLLGWGGITDDGKNVKYSPENAKAILLKYDDLVKIVKNFASDINNYRVADVEKNVKKVVAYFEWQLEWGGHQKVLELAEQRGIESDALKNKPELHWWLEHYIDDFSALSSYRTSGVNGPNPIDLPSIVLYTKIYGIRNIQQFLIVIKKLDTLFLNHFYKEK